MAAASHASTTKTGRCSWSTVTPSAPITSTSAAMQPASEATRAVPRIDCPDPMAPEVRAGDQPRGC